MLISRWLTMTSCSCEGAGSILTNYVFDIAFQVPKYPFGRRPMLLGGIAHQSSDNSDCICDVRPSANHCMHQASDY